MFAGNLIPLQRRRLCQNSRYSSAFSIYSNSGSCLIPLSIGRSARHFQVDSISLWHLAPATCSSLNWSQLLFESKLIVGQSSIDVTCHHDLRHPLAVARTHSDRSSYTAILVISITFYISVALIFLLLFSVTLHSSCCIAIFKCTGS